MRAVRHHAIGAIAKAHPLFATTAIAKVQSGLGNYYGVLDRLFYKALEEFPLHMKDVVVLGSQRYLIILLHLPHRINLTHVGKLRPVYESVCLVYGGRTCTTIDFQHITADDSRYLAEPLCLPRNCEQAHIASRQTAIPHRG